MFLIFNTATSSYAATWATPGEKYNYTNCGLDFATFATEAEAVKFANENLTANLPTLFTCPSHKTEERKPIVPSSSLT